MDVIHANTLSNVLTKKQQKFILALSNEIKSQDNLATTSPYVIINTQNREQVRPDTHGDKYYICLDFETKIYTKSELLSYVEDDYPKLYAYLDRELIELIAFPKLRDDDFDIDEEREEFDSFIESYPDIDIVYYEEVLEASKYDINVFFTHKAYNKHFKENSHHYNEPKSYLKGLFRNPEIEGVLDVIHTLAHHLALEPPHECYWDWVGDAYRTQCEHQYRELDDDFSCCPFCGGKILTKKEQK